MTNARILILILLTTTLLLSAVSLCAHSVKAQNQATITILDAVGGTTNPVAGTYTYDDGTSVTILASGDQASATTLLNWIISTDEGSRTVSENPLTITVAGGTTYTIQPVFDVIQPIGVINLVQDLSDAAVVSILPAAGGITIPAPGTYAFTDATVLNITAMPDNGWTFSHWVITGSDVTTGHGSIPTDLEPTDNPYNVNHGYGNRYVYQPVFTQSDNPTPSPSIPEVSAIGLMLVLIAVLPVAALARRRK